MNKTEMLKWLDEHINKLSDDEKKIRPKKTCDNCYNNRQVLSTLGFYWAHYRCLHCNDKSGWSNIKSFRKEVEGKNFD